MIDATPLIYLAISVVSFLGIWLLYAKFYHDYRIDKFREEIFALRDRLFVIAEEGQLSFDDEAYGLLRSTLNGFIRFAHRLSFLSLVLFISQTTKDELMKYSFQEKFSNALAPLTPQARASLLRIHQEVHYSVAAHLFATSPFLLLVMGVSLPYGLLLQLLGKIPNTVRGFADWFRTGSRRKWADIVDSVALEEGATQFQLAA